MQVNVKNMGCWVETCVTEKNINCYTPLCGQRRHGGCVRTTMYTNHPLMGSSIIVLE
jgi:hypothetical protein